MSDYMMDRATQKLRNLHVVIEWILNHARDFPDDLYQKINDEFMPYDVKMQLFELIRSDFANAITPTVLWKTVGQHEGIIDTELDNEELD